MNKSIFNSTFWFGSTFFFYYRFPYTTLHPRLLFRKVSDFYLHGIRADWRHRWWNDQPNNSNRAAFLTFLAFWMQYKANRQQRDDIRKTSGNSPKSFRLFFALLINILLHLDYYFYNKFNRHKWKHKISSQ